jgi:hypothetical protein
MMALDLMDTADEEQELEDSDGIEIFCEIIPGH